MKTSLAIAAGLALAVPPRASAQPAAVTQVSVTERTGQLVPLDLSFTHRGVPVRLGQILGRGQPALLILSYSRCDSLCSLVLRALASAMRDVGGELGRDYRAVSVSIDPAEDPANTDASQDTLLRILGYHGQPDRWPFLRGAEPAIQRLAKSLGFGYRRDPRTGQYAHPAVVFVLTPEGRISRYLYGVRFSAAQIEGALDQARRGETAERNRHIGSSVLSCFRFDPALRKYGAAIQAAFRIGAAAILAALLTLVLLLFRWERKRGKQP